MKVWGITVVSQYANIRLCVPGSDFMCYQWIQRYSAICIKLHVKQQIKCQSVFGITGDTLMSLFSQILQPLPNFPQTAILNRVEVNILQKM